MHAHKHTRHHGVGVVCAPRACRSHMALWPAALCRLCPIAIVHCATVFLFFYYYYDVHAHMAYTVQCGNSGIWHAQHLQHTTCMTYDIDL